MTTFQRERRYAVTKLKTGKPVTCVVVEADWPEYEIVWGLIKDRVEGRKNVIEKLENYRDDALELIQKLMQERDKLK
ncbi:MAG TPA: hypothetical protein VJ987_05875, partial [Anaerolineales bacterium]|nr:hypothetical protein [Anaerolineales bacterium]